MRTLGDLATHVTQETTTLATIVKLTLTDATVFAFTSHDRTITFGGTDYLPSNSYTPASAKNSSQLNVDNLDIIGFLDSAGIVEGDIQAGRFNGAAVEIAVVNWQTPGTGSAKFIKGTIGNITRGDTQYIAELRSLTQQLQQEVIESYSVQCRADLGDSRCKVRIEPPTWSASDAVTVREAGEAGSGSVVKPTAQNGFHYKCVTAGTTHTVEPPWNLVVGGITTETGGVQWETITALSLGDVVASSSDRANFVAAALSQPDGYWNLGTITWLTGANIGRTVEVKNWTLTGKLIELYLPMPDPISFPEVFLIKVGCNKDMLDDCKLKFDNVNNNRSEIYVPNKDQFLSGDSG